MRYLMLSGLTFLLLSSLVSPTCAQPAEPECDQFEVRHGCYDLNGDGSSDTVIVTFPVSNYRFDPFSVTAKGSTCEDRGNALHGTVTIVDIDTADSYKEIAIPEDGPSDDYFTYLYWFDGKVLRRMGGVPGVNPRFDGSGRIHSYNRGQVLQTWFYPADFALSADHSVYMVEQDLYPMMTRVTLLKDFTLMRERSDDSVAFVATRGDSAVVMSSDDHDWCLLRMSDGRKGWFRCSCAGRVGGALGSATFEGLPPEKWEGALPVTLKRDVPLYSLTEPDKPIGVALKGERGRLEPGSDEYWLNLEMESGAKGKIRFCGEWVVGGYISFEIFDGLSFAD